MEDLYLLIILIQKKYEEINNCWVKYDNYCSLNMKRQKVIDMYNDEKLLSYVINYRNFINTYSNELSQVLKTFNTTNVISCRVKALNSIQFKIENYTLNHENGKIPLKKCLNDLFGVRMIMNTNITYEEILKIIKEKYPNLKCIFSQKQEYKAIHIYFGNDNNNNFQWELQLWNKNFEHRNFLSHKKYKQEYTKWEDKNS